MRSLKMPAVVLPQDDFGRLEQLAVRASAEQHPLAPTLVSELNRARVTHDRSVLSEVASLNKWVTYRVDWGPSESRCLVHPDDYVDHERQLSVLSPEGAALIGIGIGDRMPFTDLKGDPHCITLVSVDAGPRILPFKRKVSAKPDTNDEPFDPGPTAA